MSASEGAESAEVLQCAKALNRPILPVLRYSNQLPQHLSSLRLQPTGLTRSEQQHETLEYWKTRPIDSVSNVMFHEVIEDICACLVELHEQELAIEAEEPNVRYVMQHRLFSAQPPPRLEHCTKASVPAQLPLSKSGSVKKEEQSPASPPQSPPALLQEQHQDDEPRDAVVFPELLSARISMLTEDLAAVKQRVATLERAAGRGSGGAFRISSLEGRIAALEAAAVSAPPLAEIAARVTELECAVREPGRPGAYIEILCCICE